MHDQQSVPMGLGSAVAGPLVIGGIIGLPFGPFAAVHEAVSLPILVFGVTLIMVPALYVATAIAGVAPAAGGFGRSVVTGLRAGGVAMLGFAAPAAFLIATGKDSRDLSIVVGLAVLGGSILIGLRALYRNLFADRGSPAVAVVYIVWAVLAMVIGLLFYARTIEFALEGV